MDPLGGSANANALIDRLIDTSACRADTDIPEDDPRWPLVARVAFISGSAAALWALIHLVARSH